MTRRNGAVRSGRAGGLVGIGIPALVLMTAALLWSCASAPETADKRSRGESSAESAARAQAATERASPEKEGEHVRRLPAVPDGEEVPAWIERYPSDAEHYIGIGGFSGSEDRAELLERGRLAALRALAAEISTEIRSELRTVTREDSQGERYDSSTLLMDAMVEERLQGVEVVDSYYSPSIGQWFYLRLSKEEFERYRQQEIVRVEERLASILTPLSDDPAGRADASAAHELSLLLQALGAAAESPYGGDARVAVAEEEGYAFDILRARIRRVLEEIEIEPRQEDLSQPAAESAVIRVSAAAPERAAGTGRIPLRVEPATADTHALTATTDDSGRASLTIPSSRLEPGTYPVSLRVDLERLAASVEAPSTGISAPRTSFILEIRPLSVLLSAEREDGKRAGGLESSLRELVAERIPVRFTDMDGEADGSLRFIVEHRELPENDYGLVFVFAGMAVDGRRDGENVVSYRSPDIKEGGLDSEQALTRAVNKLKDHLADDPEFDSTLQAFVYGK
ncbi:MAG: hypothetical protein ACLFUX_09455 [Spirochaetaceae bacterium]